MTGAHAADPHGAVLVVNAGSSSLKFGLYQAVAGREQALWMGQFDGLQPGGLPMLRQAGQPARPLAVEAGVSCADAALTQLLALLVGRGVRPLAVAHRIVHGGTFCTEPCLLNDDNLAQLEQLAPLVPLHQPFNLRGVHALRALLPDVPQIGCFDTAFHAGLPATEHRLPLPQALADLGLRRYGFHGLSYQHLVTTLEQQTGGTQGRWLLAHLGSGASLCAMVDGRVLATTMGMSALDGLMMGTRCGSVGDDVLGSDRNAVPGEQRLGAALGQRRVRASDVRVRFCGRHAALTVPVADTCIAVMSPQVGAGDTL